MGSAAAARQHERDRQELDRLIEQRERALAGQPADGSARSSLTVRAGEALGRFLWRFTPWGRYRHLTAPYWLSLALATLAGAASDVGGAAAVAAPAAAAVLLGAGLWWLPALYARWRARRTSYGTEDGATRGGWWLDRTPERAYAVAVVAVTAAATDAVVVAGWTPVTGWGWAALTVACGLPWQAHYRWWLRGPRKTPSRAEHEWRLLVEPAADVRPVLGGSRLEVTDENPETRHAEGSLTVRFGVTAAQAAQPAVARAVESLLDLPDRTVTITPRGGDHSTREARYVQAPARHLVKVPREWTEPTLDLRTGRYLIGASDDHEHRAELALLVDGDGVRHTMTVGGSGAGKDVVAMIRVLEVAHCGIGLQWEVDGGHGTSLPHVAAAFDWRAWDPDDWHEVLSGYARILEARKARYARNGWGYWTLQRELEPMLRLHVGEAQWVTQRIPWAGHLIRSIGREGRKLGLAVDVSVGDPNAENLGTREARNDLGGEAGTVIAMKCGDGTTTRLTVQDDNVDLTQLPGGGGWMVLVGGAAPGRPGHRVKVRSNYLHHKSDMGEPAIAQTWAARAVFPQLHPEDVEAAGDAYRHRFDERRGRGHVPDPNAPSPLGPSLVPLPRDGSALMLGGPAGLVPSGPKPGSCEWAVRKVIQESTPGEWMSRNEVARRTATHHPHGRAFDRGQVGDILRRLETAGVVERDQAEGYRRPSEAAREDTSADTDSGEVA